MSRVRTGTRRRTRPRPQALDSLRALLWWVGAGAHGVDLCGAAFGALRVDDRRAAEVEQSGDLVGREQHGARRDEPRRHGGAGEDAVDGLLTDSGLCGEVRDGPPAIGTQSTERSAVEPGGVLHPGSPPRDLLWTLDHARSLCGMRASIDSHA